MQRIRTQLMTPGEWDDPGIPPLDSINRRLTEDARQLPLGIVAQSAHEHTLRWLTRQRAKADAHAGGWIEYTRP